MSISVAIVGSGPAGFYTAATLLKAAQPYDIDIIERLPSPYGLVRYGVAPDHQTTKKICKVFARTAEQEPVRYYGNVNVGVDITIDELRNVYDAVVIAVGAPNDREWSVDGCKRGVLGATSFVGWYNGHPDFQDLEFNLDVSTVAVIGNGNVAIDVARVLVKTRDEMSESDLPDYASKAIHNSRLDTVHVFGRRGPIEASFTNVELREMGQLEDCLPVVDGNQIPDCVLGKMSDRDYRLKERNLATLREFSLLKRSAVSKRVQFQFFSLPREILGDDRVEGLRIERTVINNNQVEGTKEYFDVECGLIIYALGNRGVPLNGVPYDKASSTIKNIDGRVSKGLYGVGWAARRPVGVISTNRQDAMRVCSQIESDIQIGEKRGRSSLEKILCDRNVKCITFDQLKQVDNAEVVSATDGAPRRKFLRLEDMQSIL